MSFDEDKDAVSEEHVEETCHKKDEYFDFYYVKLLIEGADLDEMNAVKLKLTILGSLECLFGLVGKSLPFDIMKYDATTQEAILRCRKSVYKKIINSIILCKSTYKISVLKSSQTSLGLISDSRKYNHSNFRYRKKRKLSENTDVSL